MSKPPLNWHPATWPWPHEKCDHSDCEAARRARDLISRDGKYQRDIQGDIICRMAHAGEFVCTLWWMGSRRIEIVSNNKLIVQFNERGLQKTTDDPFEIKAARDALRQRMILEDIANA